MIGKKVSLAEFKEHLAKVKPARVICRVIVHHFWRPSAAQWKGLTTLQGVRDFHVNDNGWSDIGYHVVIGPDSTIWLARPLEQVGAHCAGENEDTIGLAYAANFDEENPVENGLTAGHQSVAGICQRFKLTADSVHFHHDFSTKTCPGTKMDRAAFRLEVSKLLAPAKKDGFIRLKIDGKPVWAANIHIETGKAVGFEGPIAKAIGAPLPPDQKRLVVVREYLAQHGFIVPPDGWHPELGPAGTILAHKK